MQSVKGEDLFESGALLTEKELETRERVAEYVHAEVAPGAAARWLDGRFDHGLLSGLAHLGVVGAGIEGYGCSGLGEVTEGIVAEQLAVADVGMAAFFGIQSSLAMRAIHGLGSVEQKQRWLPGLARIDLIGACGMTEPDHGSDVGSMESTATRVPGGYILNGRKRWVGNAAVADAAVIFARGESGKPEAFVIEKGTAGFDAMPIQGKVAFRTAHPTNIVMSDVFVPDENRLADSANPRNVHVVLDGVRPVAAWQALGAALGAYRVIVNYLGEREQFGRPLAGFQLVQEKLAGMSLALSSTRLSLIRTGRMLEEGTMTQAHAAAVKMESTRRSRQVVADARDLMGGNGILAEHTIGRHFADMEALFTLDGTDHMQALILGRYITGLSAVR